MPGKPPNKAAFAGSAAAALILPFATAAPTLELPQAGAGARVPRSAAAAGRCRRRGPRFRSRARSGARNPASRRRRQRTVLPQPRCPHGGRARRNPVPICRPTPRSALRADPSGTMPAAETPVPAAPGFARGRVQEHDAELDAAAGCSIPYPLMLSSFGRGIALEPAAQVSCPMAEASARFIQEVAAPAAESAFGKELKSVAQASAYVCRASQRQEKLSEHAFGNALDIAAFTLAEGAEVAVELRPESEAAIFSELLRKAACGPSARCSARAAMPTMRRICISTCSRAAAAAAFASGEGMPWRRISAAAVNAGADLSFTVRR